MDGYEKELDSSEETTSAKSVYDSIRKKTKGKKKEKKYFQSPTLKF